VVGWPWPATNHPPSCSSTHPAPGWGRQFEEQKKENVLVKIKTILKVKKRKKHKGWKDNHKPTSRLMPSQSLNTFKVSCPDWVPSQSPAHPQFTGWGGNMRNRESLNAVQALFSNSWKWCVSNAVLVSNPKHSIICTTVKKLNSVPARSSIIS